jgi:aldehyde:ferredoxin oxidoreductase
MIAKSFIGGRGLNSKALFDEVSTLSSYSGLLGDGNTGDKFPTFLKWAGCDQIVITGKAKIPKYLWIDNKSVELRDASDLWGRTTWYPSYRNFQKYFSREVPCALTAEACGKYEIGRTSYYKCPNRCKNVYRIPTGKHAGEEVSVLEHECINSLGTNCGIEDPIIIMEVGNLTDKYGSTHYWMALQSYLPQQQVSSLMLPSARL